MKQLLLLSLLTSIGLSNALADDSAAIADIKKAGGLVLPWPGAENAWEVEFHLRGRDLKDKGLAQVAALKTIASLNLRDTQITSAGLKHLAGLSQLRRLHLERTAVDDAGIIHLAKLSQLEYLNLYGTQITDKALEQLTGLKNLKQLYVWQTKVTDAGAAKLRKARPGLKLVQGVDLSKIVIVKKEEPKPEDSLKWLASGGPDQPPAKSKPGSFITVTFQNKRNHPVKLYWIDYGGGKKLYGEIAQGAERRQNTYSDAVWLITDSQDKPLGSFVTGTKIAVAVIPK